MYGKCAENVWGGNVNNSDPNNSYYHRVQELTVDEVCDKCRPTNFEARPLHAGSRVWVLSSLFSKLHCVKINCTIPALLSISHFSNVQISLEVFLGISLRFCMQ